MTDEPNTRVDRRDFMIAAIASAALVDEAGAANGSAEAPPADIIVHSTAGRCAAERGQKQGGGG
jgi:hypothetical protein